MAVDAISHLGDYRADFGLLQDLVLPVFAGNREYVSPFDVFVFKDEVAQFVLLFDFGVDGLAKFDHVLADVLTPLSVLQVGCRQLQQELLRETAKQNRVETGQQLIRLLFQVRQNQTHLLRQTSAPFLHFHFLQQLDRR